MSVFPSRVEGTQAYLSHFYSNETPPPTMCEIEDLALKDPERAYFKVAQYYGFRRPCIESIQAYGALTKCDSRSVKSAAHFEIGCVCQDLSYYENNEKAEILLGQAVEHFSQCPDLSLDEFSSASRQWEAFVGYFCLKTYGMNVDQWLKHDTLPQQRASVGYFDRGLYERCLNQAVIVLRANDALFQHYWFVLERLLGCDLKVRTTLSLLRDGVRPALARDHSGPVDDRFDACRLRCLKKVDLALAELDVGSSFEGH